MALASNDPDRSDLHLPAILGAIGHGVEHVLDFAGRHGVEDGICWELELLMEEVLANIVQHAYPSGEGHMIVQCTWENPLGILVEVRDQGIPFDPLEMPRPDPPNDLQELRTGGFGLPLIRHLADTLHYNRRGGENRLALKKYRCRLAHR